MPMVTVNGEEIYEAFGWNKTNMFFLTRDGAIAVTDFEEVFNLSNQCLLPCGEELDSFGRNQIDRMFIRLCNRIDLYVKGSDGCIEFESLQCQKIGDLYWVRLVLMGDQFTGNETLDEPLDELLGLLEKRLQRRGAYK